MEISDMPFQDEAILRQAAELLVVAFQEHWPGSWPDLDSGLEEVLAACGVDRICRIAMGGDGNALGWIGGIPEYDGNVWELHPLAVRPDQQGKGIGRALVEDFIEQVSLRGGGTIMLGSDDENNMTSVGGVDVYPDPLEHLHQIRNLKRHPYEFYQQMGFVIVGLIPDANGFGKPDILMARRVESP